MDVIDGISHDGYYSELNAPRPESSRRYIKWYEHRLIVQASHDERSMIDDIPLQFNLEDRASSIARDCLCKTCSKNVCIAARECLAYGKVIA